MAYEAYRRHRNRFFSHEASNPWAERDVQGALFVVKSLALTQPLLEALQTLDELLPQIHEARVLNVDGKGTTQWLLFYPTAAPEAPLVRVMTRSLYGTASIHVELYDRAADALVVYDSNLNYIFGDDRAQEIPSLKKEVPNLQELAAFLATNPQPPPCPVTERCAIM